MDTMCILGIRLGSRLISILALLASTAWGEGVIIHVNGYLDDKMADTFVRSGFKIRATPGEIAASLQQTVLGTSHREAVDKNVEFTINDDNFVNEWRSQALDAFRKSSVRRKQTAETRLPNGYWAIYVETSPLSFHSDAGSNPPDTDVSIQLVTKTLSVLNQLIARKEYQQISLSSSEGDTVPAIHLPLEEILADLRKWDGKRVKVTGWLSHDDEKSVIYPSRLWAWLDRKGVWVGNPSAIATGIDRIPENYEGQGEIEGVVRASSHGHLGGFPCTIDRLTISRTK